MENPVCSSRTQPREGSSVALGDVKLESQNPAPRASPSPITIISAPKMTTATCAHGDSNVGQPQVEDNTMVDEKLRSRWKSRDDAREQVRLRDQDGYRMRAAALCVKESGSDRRILLVSAGKNGNQWVVPGGGVEKNECSEDAAHRELMEEAGVRAETVLDIGVFQDDARMHRTRVFVMQVTEELQRWEEGEYGRRRMWIPLTESKNVVKPSHLPIIEHLISTR